MSNRAFKSLLNNQKYILFDFGKVDSLPTVDENISGICKCNQIFYIKQLNFNQWIPLTAKTVLSNVFYGNKGYQQNYDWYNDIDKNKVVGKNSLMIWKHNANDQNITLNFKCCNTIDGNFQNITLPYIIIDSNNVAVDFSGFENYWFLIIAN